MTASHRTINQLYVTMYIIIIILLPVVLGEVMSDDTGGIAVETASTRRIKKLCITKKNNYNYHVCLYTLMHLESELCFMILEI